MKLTIDLGAPAYVPIYLDFSQNKTEDFPCSSFLHSLERCEVTSDVLHSTWINEKTRELVTVDGNQCPEGCREPDREEVDKIFRNCYVPGGPNTGW
jgi:hypothetical protein